MKEIERGVYFSAKITNSALSFLFKRGVDLERVLTYAESPTEFMRDPSCWLKAQEVESFLNFIEKEFCAHFPGENIVQLIGHSCSELSSWGTLDSVLKMMQKPQDVFIQPERFISYFISPPPPVGSLKKDENHITFELPISNDEFPFVTEYLRACIEALPTFMNQEMAHVTWMGTKIIVNWNPRQANFFEGSESGHNINPDFMQSLVLALEAREKELEERTQDLSKSHKEIEKLKVEIENLRSSTFSLSKVQDVSVPLAPRKRERLRNRVSTLRAEVARISDYLARAQQLVTLLVGQDRMNPQVKEAMRRVDWERILKSYPTLLDQTHKHFENITEALNNTKDDENQDFFVEETKSQVQLSEVLDAAIKRVSRGRDLQINKLYFYNEEMTLFRKDMESVFVNVLRKSIDSMESATNKTLRVVTRPKGRLAEVEISDTGSGIDKEGFCKSVEGEAVEAILKRHKGKMNLMSSTASGSTFVIDLPTA